MPRQYLRLRNHCEHIAISEYNVILLDTPVAKFKSTILLRLVLRNVLQLVHCRLAVNGALRFRHFKININK
jgi:hypothetical protein